MKLFSPHPKHSQWKFSCQSRDKSQKHKHNYGIQDHIPAVFALCCQWLTVFHFAFTLLSLLAEILIRESKIHISDHWQEKGKGACHRRKMGGNFSEPRFAMQTAILKAIWGNWAMGGRPYEVLKRCTVCVHSELSGWTETMEQKVRKPVLSLLSSTLPPPREEATEPGGGAGCYRLLQGVDKTGLRVPLVTPS